jgi:hypothetical protein
MITKVFFILALIILQNILLINSALTAQKYIEVDKIVAIVETQTITNSDLNKKKRRQERHYHNKTKIYHLKKKLQNYLSIN